MSFRALLRWSDGRTGRTGFLIGLGLLMSFQIAVEPLLVADPTGLAGVVTIPYFALLMVLVARRGHDLGLTAIAAISMFLASLWAADAIARSLPFFASVRMVPPLALLIWPGEAGANTYGSSRTVQ